MCVWNGGRDVFCWSVRGRASDEKLANLHTRSRPERDTTRIINSATSPSHKEIAHIHVGSPCDVIARPQLSCSFLLHRHSRAGQHWAAEKKKKKVYEKRKYMLRPSQENQLSTQQMCVQHIQLNEM